MFRVSSGVLGGGGRVLVSGALPPLLHALDQGAPVIKFMLTCGDNPVIYCEKYWVTLHTCNGYSFFASISIICGTYIHLVYLVLINIELHNMITFCQVFGLGQYECQI